MTAAGVPLVNRDAGDILFRKPGGDIDARRFLRDAHRLAGELPHATHLLNLCRDRYAFTVTLAAALLRGQVSLLSSDRSAEQVARLADRFGTACSASDDPDATGPEGASPLRHVRVRLASDAVAGAPDNPAIAGDRLAAIVFTSGSSGLPVGHEKRWDALWARSAAAARRFDIGGAPPASIVGTVPPQHMYGFETTVLQPLHTAASSWCGPAFYPVDIRTALEAVPPPRLLVTTPLQLRALLRAGLDLPALAAIVSATAPLDPALAQAAEARWGAAVLEIFGATEVGSIASRRTVEGEAWTLYDGVRLSGSGIVTAPDAVPHGLADRVERLGGDRFRLLGRESDMVKLGGRRASLAGLTRILTGIEGVHDGVFVAPDDLDRRPSARLLAYVIAPDRSADDLLAELRAHVDPVFLPRRIVRVDSLPRNEFGKLPRAALAQLPREDA